MRNRLLAVVSVLALAAAAPGAVQAQDSSAGANVLTGQDAYGSYEDNKPGVMRHITPQDMPQPGATESSSNAPALSFPSSGYSFCRRRSTSTRIAISSSENGLIR